MNENRGISCRARPPRPQTCTAVRSRFATRKSNLHGVHGHMYSDAGVNLLAASLPSVAAVVSGWAVFDSRDRLVAVVDQGVAKT